MANAGVAPAPTNGNFPRNTINRLSRKREHNADDDIAAFDTAERAPLVDRDEVQHWAFYRAVIAEFVATLLFLYISLTVVVGSTRLGGGNAGILEAAWAFGGMIFILVYCTAGVSGGHINPAVTFGLLLARRVTVPRALVYMVAQCLGAMVGAALARGVHGGEEFHTFGRSAVNGVQPGHTVRQALAAEILGTFVLLFTVLSATDPERNALDSHVPVLAPLPIGFAVLVVHLATIPITGTGINPARSLGAAVANPHHGRWNQHWIFWVGPLVGASMAAVYDSMLLKAGAVKFRRLLQ